MNWTGGSLQRLKNTNKGIIQKQRAHFARARNQLQSGPRRSGPSAPPSYFQAGVETGYGQSPTFDPKTSRRQDRPTQWTHNKGLSSPVKQGREDAAYAYSSRQASLDLHHEKRNITPMTKFSHERKRRREPDRADPADTLWERKMELLRQQDWAGLTRSKPAQLHTTPFKDKEMIGKRRKTVQLTQPISNRPGLRRHRMQNCGEFLSASASLPKEGSIDIRFGSDAVTTQLSPARSERSLAHDSFATMLFDNDHWRMSAPDNIGYANVADQGPLGVRAQPSTRRNKLQNDRAVRLDVSSSLPLNPGRGLEAVYRDSRTRKLIKHSPVAQPCHTQADDASSCYVAQQLEGATRPLRLVFDRTSGSPLSGGESIAVQSDAIGETCHANAPANAPVCEKGKDVEQSEDNMPLLDPNRVDDHCVWKSFLPMDDSSSASSKIDALRPGRVHHHCVQQHPRGTIAAPVPWSAWSQQATHGEGTHANLTSFSTSLPSITPYSDKRIETCPLETSGCSSRCLDQQCRDQDEDVDEDEMLWKPYIFSNADKNAVRGSEDDAEVAEKMDKMPASKWKSAASTAVSSLSSSPFKLLPELTACISDSVHDAAARTPFPTSPGSMLPTIASPAAVINHTRGSIGNLNRFDFGQPPMLRTSLQNNFSGSGSASPTNNSDL